MPSAKGARAAAMWGTGQIQDGENRVLGELATGQNTAQGFLQGASDAYDPAAERYGGASDMLIKALGLGGAGGASEARAAFEAGPGYGFEVDQGIQGINRRRAAAGMLGSGNADIDAMKFTTGLARQGWGSWLDRLMGLDARGLQTTGAQAAVAGQQAGLASDYYNRRGQVIDQNVANIVGLGTGALKAGDQAKAQNQANMLALGNAGLSLLGNFMGGGSMGGGSSGGTGGTGNMGMFKFLAGT